MFRLWRSHVRYKLFAATRARLSKRLFILSSTFSPALAQTQAIAHDIASVTVLAPLPQSVVTVDAFAEAQAAQREDASRAIEALVDKLQVMIDEDEVTHDRGAGG